MTLINVVIGGETKYLPEVRQVEVLSEGQLYTVNNYQVPYNEGGKLVVMKAEELTEKLVSYEDDNEIWTAIEYWEDNELRHRSLHMQLKKGLPIAGRQGNIG